MKKLVSVCAIFALLLAIVIWEQIFVDDTLNSLTRKIEKIDAEIVALADINTDDIVASVDELDKYWTKKEQVFCLIINHNDLNRIGEQIKKVKVYVAQNNKDDCVYEIETLKFYVESYRHVMEINIQNLM